MISNNGGWAARIEAATIKDYSGNSGSGNAYDVFNIYGTINQDLVLSHQATGFPYLISGTLTINDGYILTIPKGEVIKLENAYISVYGSLVADGTSLEPIVFTSFKDDTYGGDWNKDSNISSPGLGDWYNITLNGSGGNDGAGEFDNCIFRYGGTSYYGELAILYFYYTTNGFLNNSKVEYSMNSGININSSLVQVHYSQFENNNLYGIYVSGSPLPDLGLDFDTNPGFNRFVDNYNGGYQLYYAGSAPLIAQMNDWGYYTFAEIEEHIQDDEELGSSGPVIFSPFFDPDDDQWELDVDFTVDFTAIHVGGMLHFFDQSYGNPNLITWEWDFDDDGVVDSEAKNPTFAYTNEGIYTVTLIVSNGAVKKTFKKTEYINVGNFGAVDDVMITDVPVDQGGWVYATFTRSEFDTDSFAKSTEYYSVQINDGSGWFSAGYSAAYGADTYSVICHTPIDSTAYGAGLVDFRVIASMDEGTYLSDVVTGYSVDNIKPTVPTNLLAEIGETQIALSWNESPDADFHYFGVYRSEIENFFPVTPFAYSTEPAFIDEIGVNENYYYKVTAFDYSGNESDGSSIISTTKFINLAIPKGWSGLSTWLNPADLEIEGMFSTISEKLIIMQNFSGIYYPGVNINTLINWDLLSGYAIKMSQGTTLNIVANRQQFKTLNAPAGWSIIPVLNENAVNVNELFLGIDVKVVKDVAGSGVYWPEYNINTLEIVKPGKAYFVKANSPIQINFPVLSDNGYETAPELPINSPWDVVEQSAASHIIAFSSSSLSALQPGDIIGAFTGSGACAGQIAFTGQEFALALIGDDPLTTEMDGFAEDEPLTFKVYRASENKVYQMYVSWNKALNTAGLYSTHELSAVEFLQLHLLSADGAEPVQISIYPNPTAGMLLVRGITAKASIEVLNSNGESVAKHEIFRDDFIDLSHLPNGIYILKIITPEITSSQKLIIQ